MNQTIFASAAWEKTGQVHPPGVVSGGDGRDDPLGLDHGVDRAALPEGRPWRPADADGEDPAIEEALCDSDSMRCFAGIELIEDAVPDESTMRSEAVGSSFPDRAPKRTEGLWEISGSFLQRFLGRCNQVREIRRRVARLDPSRRRASGASLLQLSCERLRLLDELLGVGIPQSLEVS